MNIPKQLSVKITTGLFLFFGILAGCENSSSDNKALINVLLIDAPGDFDEVWVEVLGVEVLPAGSRGLENGEWVFLPYTPADKTVRLTDLVGSQRLLLGRKEVPAGIVTQVRLLLGDTHYFIKNGERFPLQLANNIENFLTMNLQSNAAANFALDIYIDFDLASSVKPGASDTFVLEPVLRAFTLDRTSEVRGIVQPSAARPYVYAIHEADTFSTITSGTGEFRLRGLPPNLYRLLIRPRVSHLDSALNLTTFADSVINLGNISLKPVAKE
ncbi:DUF4382 domain-containing protein [Lunatibacter salilacus]|uniref:DUF4382 domain-containing protein n=1 Tax=Lunatibacter salilacus TaxID=2483804 RepID=UPI00131B4D94|nr:DUF4382 domain-containing protein [Lunatibacter salilacus]